MARHHANATPKQDISVGRHHKPVDIAPIDTIARSNTLQNSNNIQPNTRLSNAMAKS